MGNINNYNAGYRLLSTNKNTLYCKSNLPISADLAKRILKYTIKRLNDPSNTLFEEIDYKLLLLLETTFSDNDYIQQLILQIKNKLISSYVLDYRNLTRAIGNNDLFKNVFVLNDLHEKNFKQISSDATEPEFKSAMLDFPVNIPNAILRKNTSMAFNDNRYFRKRFIWHKNKEEET